MAVFGKLSGEVYDNIRPYLDFAQDFLRYKGITPVTAELRKTPLYLFLYNLVSYNQLLALVADARLSPKSCGSSEETLFANKSEQTRPDFAALLSRISENAQDVSSFDIDSWDGNLDFLPSFTTKKKVAELPGSADTRFLRESLSPAAGRQNRANGDEEFIIGEIYRTSSRVHFFQQLRDRDELSYTTTTLAFPPFMAQRQIKRFSKLAMRLFRLLSDNSQFNTAILLPLGIIAPELTSKRDQTFVIEKLKMLERTQCFDVFRVFSQDLQSGWARARASQSAYQSASFPETPVRLIG
ncbi:uncharacterized protein A1O5_10608 [Cladophialophora psammophila CBS 110553]|uniref:Uncharacterized protein n=1 Tax=Cladophialophora psammophila CBS 110553 TaxID=1182543 RepID=W9WP82_9EURO|nr:uncharacterized protein A1O5_10608 [Cladophialophora psammophila CBS 110553]EXJ66456.1 hypothetical protein A1O5_10608 [Cladophialophora psammophila CBS 110553]